MHGLFVTHQQKFKAAPPEQSAAGNWQLHIRCHASLHDKPAGTGETIAGWCSITLFYCCRQCSSLKTLQEFCWHHFCCLFQQLQRWVLRMSASMLLVQPHSDRLSYYLVLSCTWRYCLASFVASIFSLGRSFVRRLILFRWTVTTLQPSH